jgi:uncharacterized oligopeptide transporter (OPT) family protein
MGAVLGMAMSVSKLYTPLKVGWSFGVAITSCVLSFVIWNAFRALSGGRLSRMSILENNCMQSTASAAGYSTGATIATAFGALLLIDPEHRHYPWHVVGAFTLLTGLMGVLLAIPMKRQMINHEQLPFPSGIAAATTLRSLYSEGRDAVRQAYALVVALLAGAVIGVLNTGEGTLAALDRFFAWMRANLFNVQLPEQMPAEGLVTAGGKPMVGAGLESSGLLIAAGLIVGLRVSVSMLVSSALLYFCSPAWLVNIHGAHARRAGWGLLGPAHARRELATRLDGSVCGWCGATWLRRRGGRGAGHGRAVRTSGRFGGACSPPLVRGCGTRTCRGSRLRSRSAGRPCTRSFCRDRTRSDHRRPA